ncbi:MAG: Mannosylfructose-phosphate synthase [Syntrophorhabdus sp. PtaB.Bin027]|nr:MAG: Mannosylfructose-phosphate synthase [Syntrophorhabdus sp. PtaB.Bin027]
MKIGIFFSSSPDSGGAFQYQTTFLDILKRDENNEFFIITSNFRDIEMYKNDFPIIDFSIFYYFFKKLKRVLPIDENKKIMVNSNILDISSSGKNNLNIMERISHTFFSIITRYLKSKDIALIIYLGPTIIAHKIDIPYVFTVYDLQHRIYSEFPEVSKNGVYESREYLYWSSLPKSLAIITESSIGKEDIINFYGIDDKKIFSLPLLPPSYLQKNLPENILEKVKVTYSLPDHFLFYPANFWPHKNHVLIIEALNILKKQDICVNIVFTGSLLEEYGIYNKIKELSEKYEISQQVYYLGRIGNQEMSALYMLASALVMPTFFGPSNIPYLEAFYFNCPVITSDLRGIREQVQDGALLIDPTSPEELSESIKKIMSDEALRGKLIANGHAILEKWTYEDFSRGLNVLIRYCINQISDV